MLSVVIQNGMRDSFVRLLYFMLLKSVCMLMKINKVFHAFRSYILIPVLHKSTIENLIGIPSEA